MCLACCFLWNGKISTIERLSNILLVSLSFLGLVATLGASFCLYIFIQQSPWIWSLFTSNASAASIESSIGFIGCIAAGVLLYVYHMYKNSTRGVDMRTLYIAIPPE